VPGDNKLELTLKFQPGSQGQLVPQDTPAIAGHTSVLVTPRVALNGLVNPPTETKLPILSYKNMWTAPTSYQFEPSWYAAQPLPVILEPITTGELSLSNEPIGDWGGE